MGQGHSEEYKLWINSIAWKEKSKAFRAATKQCCLFPWKKATCSHHVYYGNMGREWLVRDCVPLSQKAHAIVHQNKYWNAGGNPKTPSKLRPYISNYLRAIAVVLVILNPVLTILGLAVQIVKIVSQAIVKNLETETPPPAKSKPIIRKRR